MFSFLSLSRRFHRQVQPNRPRQRLAPKPGLEVLETRTLLSIGVWQTEKPLPATGEEYAPGREDMAAAVGMSSISRSPLIFSIGGKDNGGNILGRVDAYDTFKRMWMRRADMPTPRDSLVAATAGDGSIYAIGGTDSGGNLRSRVEIYNPFGNFWTRGPNFPEAIEDMAAVTAGGRIYVMGGTDENGTDDEMTMFDPNTRQWVQKAEMPTARDSLAAAVSKDGTTIYAIGGRDSNGNRVNTVEAYNTITDKWTTVRSMPDQLEDHAAVTGSDGRIYVMGGTDNNGNAEDDIFAYDPAKNTWTTGGQLTDMPTDRSSLAAAVSADGGIYAIGGNDGNGNFLDTVESFHLYTRTGSASMVKTSASQSEDPTFVPVLATLPTTPTVLESTNPGPVSGSAASENPVSQAALDHVFAVNTDGLSANISDAVFADGIR